MIPNTEVVVDAMEEVTYPTKTYKINVDADRIQGYTDELDAVIQSIYLILNTERYQYIIYSWDYGVELLTLYGKPMPYVMVELERRIKEALLRCDDRVTEVTNFVFEKTGKKLHVTFDVKTIYGTIQTEKELAV